MSKSLNHVSPQRKAEVYQRIEAILETGPFLCGTRAVHRAHFLYTLRWSQAGARISEMNDLGWQIASLTLPEWQWQNGIRTAYRLDSKPLPSSNDWYEREHGPRPSDKSKQDEIVLPLFEGQR